MSRREGFVSVSVLMMGLIILLLGFSLLTIQVYEYKVLQSTRHRMCAHYMAESGMEIMLWDLYEWGEAVLRDYEDLAVRGALSGADPAASFESHLRLALFHKLEELRALEGRLQPVPHLYDPETGSHSHHLRIRVESETANRRLILTVQGICGQARVTQQAVVALPGLYAGLTGCGTGLEYRLTSLYLVSRMQISSPWL